MNSLEQLKKNLNDWAIVVDYYEHEPIFTAEQGMQHTAHIPGLAAKNLFLYDKNNQFWLVVVPYNIKLSVRKLAALIGAPELRFASPEQLVHYLGVTPGSVTPLAVMNDVQHEVRIVLDTALMAVHLIQIHPLRNDMTITITPQDLLKFVQMCGNQYSITGVPTAA